MRSAYLGQFHPVGDQRYGRHHVIRLIARIPGLATAMTVLSYALAVCTLTWLTVDNHLGDQLYGQLVMLLIAFPVSIAALLANSWLSKIAIGERTVDIKNGWDYFLPAWSGILMAVILVVLLLRWPTAGRVLGWFLAGFLILAGLGIAFDQWAPRRPYGWPFLVYGLVMIIGLLGSRTKDRSAVPGRDTT
jgi:hypothetical protein